jgi:uncharacterized protein YceK
MRKLVIGFGLLALLSGCVSVHVHFPQAEPEKTESAPPAAPSPS